jgi:hypothetical protein
LATYRGERALYRALRQKGKSYPVGYCLRWVREQFGVSAYYRYAYQVWQNCPSKLRHVTSDAPPRGTIALYRAPGTSGYPGHIAISIGGGYIVSTDLPYSGRIGVVHYRAPERKWGLSYVGYTRWVNQRSVWAPFIDASNVAAVARKSRSRSGLQSVWGPPGVARVEYRLYRRGLLAKRRVNRWWNKYSTAAYAAWQRKCGYSSSDADGVPGLKTLRRLARLSPYATVGK